MLRPTPFGAWRALATALAVSLSAAAPAAAQSIKDASGRLTANLATSRCLGEPATPICATETLLACLARADAALCRAAAISTPAAPSDAPPQIEYVIERVSVIRQADVTDDLKDLEWYKPGYTLVELLRRACPASQADCRNENWDGMQVYLRQRGDAPAWEIVHWRGDAEQDTPPQEPDNFQRPNPPTQ